MQLWRSNETNKGVQMNDTEILNYLIESLQKYLVMSEQDITDLLIEIEEKRK